MKIIGTAPALKITDTKDMIIGSLADAFSIVQKENFMVTDVIMSRESYNIFFNKVRSVTDTSLLDGKIYLRGALISIHNEAINIYCFNKDNVKLLELFPKANLQCSM